MFFEVSRLRKTFGSIVALDGLDLDIRRGEIFGLLGPNGAGKSTFMNLVTGFHESDGGEISLDGRLYCPGNSKDKAILGFVPQNIALYDELSPIENLRLFGSLSGLSGNELHSKIDRLLERIELFDRRTQKIKDFSGGMKRRLNIAAGLLHDPQILLCDEPTVGIDPQSRNAIFELLRGLNDNGTTIIYSTHYMEEAEKLCDRIGIIDRGKILAIGTLDQLLEELPNRNRIYCSRDRLPDRISAADLRQFGALSVARDHHVIETSPDFRLSRFFAWIENHQLDPRWFRIQQSTLEDLFLHLTGRDLRE